MLEFGVADFVPAEPVDRSDVRSVVAKTAMNRMFTMQTAGRRPPCTMTLHITSLFESPQKTK